MKTIPVEQDALGAVTHLFSDHMVLDYKDGVTSYEEIYFVNDD